MGSGIYVPREYGGPAHHLWNEQNAGRFLLGRWKRVVNVSDGWLSVHATPDEFADSCEKIEDYAQQTNPEKKFARAFNCAVLIADDERSGWNQVKAFLNHWHTMIGDDVVDRWAVAGPPEVVAERLNEYRDRGANIFQLLVAEPGNPTKQIELIGKKVLPLLR